MLKSQGLHDLFYARFGLFPELVRCRKVSDHPTTFVAGFKCDIPSIFDSPRIEFGAQGIAETPEQAVLIATMEGLERQSLFTLRSQRLIAASARDMGAQCVDLLSRSPKHDPSETAPDGRRLSSPGVDEILRWLPAEVLGSQADAFVPLVMAHIATPLASESYWMQISTGCAAHVEPELSLNRAFAECYERDALALTWLLNRSVRQVEPRGLTVRVQTFVESQAQHGIQVLVFDATVERQVPVVLALEIAQHSRAFRQIMTCAAGRTVRQAADSAVKDLASARGYLQGRRAQLLANGTDAVPVDEGALFMADAANSQAFDFLLGARASNCTSHDPIGEPGLGTFPIAEILESSGHAGYSLDISSREALDHGVVVTRVIIPDLQPYSPYAWGQYRAHDRIAAVQRAEGQLVLQPNDYPIPLS